MDDEDRYTRITLRIPRDLHAKLDAAADATSKSLNAEILARLGESFERKPDAVILRVMADVQMKLASREVELEIVASTAGLLADIVYALVEDMKTKGVYDLPENKQESIARAINNGAQYRLDYCKHADRAKNLLEAAALAEEAERAFREQGLAIRKVRSSDSAEPTLATYVEKVKAPRPRKLKP